MAGTHHVLLVPGFFGFATLGEFAYFAHVRDFLAEVLPEVGVRGEVRVVHTVPTAALERRAAILAEAVARLLEAGPAAVSVVGHSSGGLDARLLVSPGARLPTGVDVERCARSVRAVVTVATPHHGTPLAHAFNSILGSQLLRVLSLATMYGLRAGRLPIHVVLRLARVFRRRGEPATVLQQLWAQLLHDFSADRRRAIEAFFGEVGEDRGLLAQITPAGSEAFDAATPDRPGVRYGCVVTRARPPGLRSFVRAGVDPYAHATHALFVALYRLASRTAAHRVRLPPERIAELSRAFRRSVDHRTNDGMVPTLSQVRGELVRAAWADHHDVIGHFHHPTHVPPHFDWVASGTGFTRARFEAIWRDVAAFVAAAGEGRPPGAGRRTPEAAAVPAGEGERAGPYGAGEMARARHAGAQRPPPAHRAGSMTSASPPTSEIAPQPRRRHAPQRLQREAAMARGGAARAAPAQAGSAAGDAPSAARRRARMRGGGSGRAGEGGTGTSYRTGSGG